MAITLVNEKDRFALKNIEELLEKKVPVKPLPEGMEEPKEEVATSKKRVGESLPSVEEIINLLRKVRKRVRIAKQSNHARNIILMAKKLREINRVKTKQ
jgi:hypothetical protein